MNHKVEVKAIKDHINRLFADTDVSPEKTRESLEDIREEIDGLIDTLPSK